MDMPFHPMEWRPLVGGAGPWPWPIDMTGTGMGGMGAGWDLQGAFRPFPAGTHPDQAIKLPNDVFYSDNYLAKSRRTRLRVSAPPRSRSMPPPALKTSSSSSGGRSDVSSSSPLLLESGHPQNLPLPLPVSSTSAANSGNSKSFQILTFPSHANLDEKHKQKQQQLPQPVSAVAFVDQTFIIHRQQRQLEAV